MHRALAFQWEMTIFGDIDDGWSCPVFFFGVLNPKVGDGIGYVVFFGSRVSSDEEIVCVR